MSSPKRNRAVAQTSQAVRTNQYLKLLWLTLLLAAFYLLSLLANRFVAFGHNQPDTSAAIQEQAPAASSWQALQKRLHAAFTTAPTAVWQSPPPIVTVSAASFDLGGVAPDSIVAAFGVNLATRTEVARSTPLPTSMAGTTVKLKDRAGVERFAQLFFVAPSQVNFLVPADTALGTADLTIANGTGAVSTGKVQIIKTAPGLFSVNTSGSGIPNGLSLRVLNGVQTTRSLARFDASLNRQVAVPLDLSPDTGQVFLVLFGTGLRGRDSLTNVQVRLGGLDPTLIPITYAGAQGLAGLDQINIGPLNRQDLRTRLLGRGMVNLALTIVDSAANVTRASNVVEVEVSGLTNGPTAPAVNEPGAQVFFAGQMLNINGGPFVVGSLTENRVRIGSLAAQVITATADRLTVLIPYGAQTGRISVSTPAGERTTNESLQIGTSISGVVESSERQPLAGVQIKLVGGSDQATTRADGSFVLPINISSPSNSFATTIQISAQGARGYETYGTLFRRIEVAAKRDNRLPANISLQLPQGRSVAAGGSMTLSLPVFACTDAANPSVPGVATFKLESGTAVQFPSDVNTNLVTLAQVQNCRTPLRLPARIYGSRIVQITPLGARFNPGGQLIFPNTDSLPAGTVLTLYRLNQQTDSPTLGDFIEIGTATVNSQGDLIETGARAITEGGIYFVAPAPTLFTNVHGRVIERVPLTGGRTEDLPVHGALVSVRGQVAFTDGDGSFIVRHVPVAENNDTFTVEASLVRADGRADSVQRFVPTVAIRPNSTTTVTPELVLTVVSPVGNRAPSAASQNVTLNEDSTKVITLGGSDPDGNPLRYTYTNPLHGTLSGAPPYLIYTPELNYNGPDNFNFRVNDGKADSASAIVALTISPINDAPVLTVPGPQTIKEGSLLGLTLTATDVDTGQTITISATSLPQGATFVDSIRRFTWTPGCTQAGTYTATFVAADNGTPVLQSEVRTITITVQDENCAPVLSVPVAQTVNEGQALNFSISAADPDPGQRLTLAATNLPAGANFNPATGQFSWTPTCIQAGSVTVSFTVTDDGAPPRTDTRTVGIQVNDVKTAPTLITPEIFNISEGAPLTFTVSATATCSNQSVVIDSANLPQGATLSPATNTNGTITRQFSWTPTFEQSGSYAVRFTSSDSNDPTNSTSRNVTINVVDFNRDPELTVPGPRGVPVGQQFSLTVTATDPDPGQTITLSVANPPPDSVFNTTPGNPASGTFVWTPNFSQIGLFTLDFRATDSGAPARTATKSVLISVGGDCDPTLLVPGPQTVAETLPLTFTVVAGPKCPGQTVTLAAAGLPPRATFNAQTGQFNWTPNIGEVGSYTATFTATDNSTPAKVTTRTVAITVTQNRPPTANPQTVTTAEDTAKAITLTGTDPENQPLTFVIVTPPTRGTLTGTAPNVIYTPVANLNGVDSFTFKVNDGRLDSAPATVSITVTAGNDPPTVQSQSLAISEDTPANVTLQANDPDGDPLTYTITQQPTNGTLTGTAPNLVYTPRANFFGRDEFKFRVNDGTVDSNEGTVTLMITAVNDAPVVTVPDQQTVLTSQNVSFNVTATDVDTDQTLAISVSGLPAGATFNQTNTTATAAAGQFSWTPTEAQAGTFTVTFIATDNGTPVLSTNKTVTIIVNPITSPITITAPDERTVNETEQLTFTVSASGGTIGQSWSLSASNLPSGASFPAATGSGDTISQTFTWTPSSEQAGEYQVTFTAQRGGAPATKITRIRVVNSCRPPVLSVPTSPVNGADNQEIRFTVSATDPDSGDALTLSATNLPTGAVFPVTTNTNSVSQQFVWTPASGQIGTFTVTFNVMDNCSPMTRSATATVTINVVHVNAPPVLTVPGAQTATLNVPTDCNTPVQGQPLTFEVTARDPDTSDAVTITATGLPPGATFNQTNTTAAGASGTFTWVPNLFGEPGTFTVSFTASDNSVPPQTDTKTVTITFTIPNNAQRWQLTGMPRAGVNITLLTVGNDIFAAAEGAGVYRTSNNGQTWPRVDTTGLTNPDGRAFIVKNTETGPILFLGTPGGGVYRSSDSGVTWTQINTGLTHPFVRAMAVNDQGVLFAGTLGGGVFFSNNNGSNWQPFNVGLPLVDLTINALVTTGTGANAKIYAATNSSGIFELPSNGLPGINFSWMPVGTGLPAGQTGPVAQINTLEISGNGATLFAGFNGEGVYRLVFNGPGFWERVSNGLFSNVINDLYASGTTLYAATQQGIGRSTDAGTTWVPIDDCLPYFNISSLTINRLGTKLFAGTNDGRTFIRQL